MTNNHLFDSVVAIVMGTGIGMLIAAGGQKMINRHHQINCPSQPGHSLILVRGFLGDEYYCVKPELIKV
jgi:hypothetical protein